MRRALPSLNGLRVFEVAARCLGFTRAADELGLTQGAVSYQIKQLEDDLGFALFRREGRTIALTDAGRRLLPVLQRSFTDIAGTVAGLRAEQTNQIAIAVSTYFASRWLLPRLTGFMARHPDIGIRLVHLPGVAHQGMPEADIAVRWGQGGWRDGRVELLFEASLTPVCSPAVAAGAAPVTAPRDLRDHIFLHDDETQTAWLAWLKLAGVGDPGLLRGPVIVDPNVRMQAAIDGQGFALADDLVADDIAAGRLVAPFAIRLDGHGYHLIHRPETLQRPTVALFRDWLLAETKGQSA